MTHTARPAKNVILVAPKSTGGNFEYVAIPRQGPLYISAALKQWEGGYRYDREVWYEDRNGKIDPVRDLEDVDVLMITALINEAPRAYEITRMARRAHPDLKIIGGGPHMSPLHEEALRYGMVDVVVLREGEDIIGQLCDVMLSAARQDLTARLHKIPGIAFLEDGEVVQTKRRGVIRSDLVELPDFAAMKDLTPQNPLAAGVIETVRGCTENCTYCQVIQQFLGYRMVARDVELKRLAQLHKLAEDGLIYTAKDGRFSVFVSDDLHPPPLRATRFRTERLERLKAWKGRTDKMWMVCQTRAEIGQDPELAEAMVEAGFRMLYVGVESSSAENLKAVKKRQDPGQMHQDLAKLSEMGFIVTAMTIIGLPYDTEESIMQMADWARTVSRYQTANLLTPLPATINWEMLRPLDEDGSLLPQGKMRPYHLYTGHQLVHYDERWGLEASRDLYARYTARLRPVDKMYERIFRIFKSAAYYGVVATRQEEASQRSSITTGRTHSSPFEARLGQLEESVRRAFNQTRDSIYTNISEFAASVSPWFAQAGAPGSSRAEELRLSTRSRVNELQEALSTRMDDLGATVTSRFNELRSGLSSSTGDFREQASHRLDELSEAVSARVNDMSSSVATRIAELRGTVVIRIEGDGKTTSYTMGELADSVAANINHFNETVSARIHEFKRRSEYGRQGYPETSALS